MVKWTAYMKIKLLSWLLNEYMYTVHVYKTYVGHVGWSVGQSYIISQKDRDVTYPDRSTLVYVYYWSPRVGGETSLSVGSVCRLVCHYFLKGQGTYTPRSLLYKLLCMVT